MNNKTITIALVLILIPLLALVAINIFVEPRTPVGADNEEEVVRSRPVETDLSPGFSFAPPAEPTEAPFVSQLNTSGNYVSQLARLDMISAGTVTNSYIIELTLARIVPDWNISRGTDLLLPTKLETETLAVTANPEVYQCGDRGDYKTARGESWVFPILDEAETVQFVDIANVVQQNFTDQGQDIFVYFNANNGVLGKFAFACEAFDTN